MAEKARTQLVHFSQAGLVRPFISYLESMGIETKEYLAQAGLNESLLEDESTPVPTRMFFNFLNPICRDYAIEDPGMLVGKTTSLYMLGTFGQLLMSTNTMHEYLTRGCQHINGRASGDNYWLKEDPEEVEFCISVTGLEKADKVQNYLYVIFVTINTLRQILGEGWCPRQVSIPGASRSTAASLSATLAGTEVLRNGRYACFTIPSTFMSYPMPKIKYGTKEYLVASDKKQLPVDFLDSIRKLIGTLIITGRTDIATVGQAAGLNRRTLQRRLSESGTTYSALLAETRIDTACRWIQEDKWPLAEIAQQLGYNNPANFSRAFRRITGVAPKHYQSRHVRAAKSKQPE